MKPKIITTARLDVPDTFKKDQPAQTIAAISTFLETHSGKTVQITQERGVMVLTAFLDERDAT